jgi:DNA-3-methyladenine glycosylase I
VAGTVGAVAYRCPVTDLVTGADGLSRCAWGAGTADYVAYHDAEWGRPVRDDDGLYERLCLEAFQSGLSWLTILRKRAAFRRAFDGFRIDTVAGYGEDDVRRLLSDAGIVRNRAKIEASIANARAALDLPDGLAELLWGFAPPARPARPANFASVPAVTAESTAMAKALKRSGFRFVGPTTAYALMQATGMVDDHLAGCHVPPPAAVPASVAVPPSVAPPARAATARTATARTVTARTATARAATARTVTGPGGAPA